MVPLSKFVAAGVETSYIPLGSGTLRVYPGIRATQSRLFDFAFSLQIRVPVKRRWMPYGTLSSGVLYNTYSIAAIQPGNSTVGSSESDTKFAFEGGGGVRYYIRDNWGVTGEYQYTVSSQNFSRLLWGVFYELDDSWPFRSRRGASRGQGIPR
jgi:opacity protein-like surface antigen